MPQKSHHHDRSASHLAKHSILSSPEKALSTESAGPPNLNDAASAASTRFRTSERSPGHFSPLPGDMSTSGRKKPQDIEREEARSGYGDEKDVATAYDVHADVSGVDEAKLIRKIDWRLLPWLSFLYLLSFLDRTSIGNARVRRLIPLFWVSFDMGFRQLYNMADDLHLSDKEYLLCLTIFYFSYAFFEVHSPSPRGSLSGSDRVPIGPK